MQAGKPLGRGKKSLGLLEEQPNFKVSATYTAIVHLDKEGFRRGFEAHCWIHGRGLKQAAGIRDTGDFSMPSMKRPSSGVGMDADKGRKNRKGRGESLPEEAADDSTQLGTLNGQISGWTADAEHRDKGKGEKFAKLKSSGQLPPYILNMYESPPPGTSARAYRTAMVNRLFHREADGSLRLRSSDPMFTQAKKAYEDKYHKATTESYTRMIFAGMFFANDDNKLQAAIDKGEVLESKGEDGEVLYSMKKIVRGVRKGAAEETTLTAAKSLSEKEYAEMAQLMDEFKISYTFSKKDKALLDDGKLPDSAVKTLNQAIAANERLSKQAAQLSQKHSAEFPNNVFNELKKQHKVSQKNILNLQHIMAFQEIENEGPVTKNSLDRIMMACAKDTSELNQAIEIAKGVLKAKRN